MPAHCRFQSKTFCDLLETWNGMLIWLKWLDRSRYRTSTCVFRQNQLALNCKPTNVERLCDPNNFLSYAGCVIGAMDLYFTMYFTYLSVEMSGTFRKQFLENFGFWEDFPRNMTFPFEKSGKSRKKLINNQINKQTNLPIVSNVSSRGRIEDEIQFVGSLLMQLSSMKSQYSSDWNE